jgi:hypothetical protein
VSVEEEDPDAMRKGGEEVSDDDEKTGREVALVLLVGPSIPYIVEVRGVTA